MVSGLLGQTGSIHLQGCATEMQPGNAAWQCRRLAVICQGFCSHFPKRRSPLRDQLYDSAGSWRLPKANRPYSSRHLGANNTFAL